MDNWTCYIIRCSDGSLYTGVTNDLGMRIKAHNAGVASKYTRGRGPVTLVANSRPLDRSSAQNLEYEVKKLPADEKVSGLFRIQKKY
jgi:putative endonuclease